MGRSLGDHPAKNTISGRSSPLKISGTPYRINDLRVFRRTLARLRLYPGDWRSAAGHAPIPSVSGDIEGPATQRRLPRLPRRRAGDDRFHLAAGGSPELLRAALRTAPRRRRTSSTRSRRSTSAPVAGSGPFPLIHGFRTSALVRPFGFVGRRSHSCAWSPATSERFRRPRGPGGCGAAA